MEQLRIIFMGTAEFAVPSLEILVKNDLNIVGVITAPDKPQGRGQMLSTSPVKQAALRFGIKVLQPASLKSPEFLEELKSLGANLQIVVAFRMLPEVVWSMPAFGTFNLHASLLPQYRGAAPINWAVINGEKQTGVTTFFLKQQIDTGSIIFQEKETISDDDDAGTLYDRLKYKGASLVLKTLNAISGGAAPSLPQVEAKDDKHAPKIFKETCRIQWNETAGRIRNFVRGLSPYPAAWTIISGKAFKIFKVNVADYYLPGVAGEFITDNKSYLYIKAEDAWVSVLELQAEGKKRMSCAEFFRGNKL